MSSGQPDLTAEQIRELDDNLLSSDPWGHFRSSIQMLLGRYDAARLERAERRGDDDREDDDPDVDADADEGLNGPPGQARSAFDALLGRPTDPFSGVSSGSAGVQVATDAYGLRHHVAECLMRLAWALLSEKSRSEASLWVRLSRGPTQTAKVLEHLLGPLRAPTARSTFTCLVIPLNYRQRWCCDARLASAIDVYGDWFQHAANLLRGHELELSAAHNKVKHGFAVRARDDLKGAITTVPPNNDGTVPASAFAAGTSHDLFDRPVIEVLADAPKVGGHRQGLEITQLRVDVPTVLAETYMLAWTHAAMFHVAALDHYADREDLPKHVRMPLYPGLPIRGPHPRHIGHKSLVGMRFPLTTPPGGGPATRSAGFGFRDDFVPLSFTGPPIRNARIVDG